MTIFAVVIGVLKTDSKHGTHRGSQWGAGIHWGHLFQLLLTFLQWHYLCSIQHNPASTMKMLSVPPGKRKFRETIQAITRGKLEESRTIDS